jgi:hypothetical protein
MTRVMLKVGVPTHLQTDPGGVLMSDLPASSDRGVLPAQIWSALATDFKTRVIWLLAQLAFNLVIAQAERDSQEVPNVTVPPHQP